MALAAFPNGSLPIRVRDHLAGVFADEPFTDSFGVRGAPGMPPAVLSLVTVLQFAENLTDRQAAEVVRDRLSWKYALGRELTDAGFDFTVLSRFRARLAEHGLERWSSIGWSTIAATGAPGPQGSCRDLQTRLVQSGEDRLDGISGSPHLIGERHISSFGGRVPPRRKSLRTSGPR
ncbi:transposase [Streptomyces sioyaensis]|uniref:transposase n=1 Tax=Streptomyces sioyaensis TaxID=67364 RepID=UPI003F540B79